MGKGTARRIAGWGAGLLQRAGGLRLLNRAVNRFEPVPAGERLAPFVRVRRRRFASLQILLYHRVGPAEDGFLPCLSVRTFRDQMTRVAGRFRVYPLDEAVEALLAGDLDDNALAITFDDGYRDNYVHALPVLEERGLSATVFLATGCIDSGRLLWHDRVFHAFRATTRDRLPVPGSPDRVVRWTTEEERQAACLEVLRCLRGLEEEERDPWVGEIAERLGTEEPSPGARLMLDWDEAREMKRRGVRFGSHTVSHPILSRVSASRARREIFESRDTIERELGGAVPCFAYPNGLPADFDETTRALLREAGYRCAVTTIFGANPGGPGAADPLALRREVPWEPHPALFEARLSLHRFEP